MMKSQKARAANLLHKAYRNGDLVRPDTCELCGVNPSKLQKMAGPRIVAHHWNGYDNPLDVWFICKSCNAILKDHHDGSMTKEDAREFVADFNRWYERPNYLKGYLTAVEYYEAEKRGDPLPEPWTSDTY